MTDLHAAVSEKLATRPILAVPGGIRTAEINAWVSAAHDALSAVLELHQPDCEKWPVCVECSCDGALAATDCHQLVQWPCPTVTIIAEKLGIAT